MISPESKTNKRVEERVFVKVSINFSEINPWFYLCIFRDELPIKLALPKAIQSAQTNQELTAIALQGQGKVFVCVCMSLCQLLV